MFDYDPETDLSPVDEAIFELLAANPDNAFTSHEIGELSGLSLAAIAHSLTRLEELGVAIRGECWGDVRVTLSQKWTDRVRAATAKPATPEADAQDDEPDDDDDEIEAEHAGGQKIKTYCYTPQAIEAAKTEVLASGGCLEDRVFLSRNEHGEWAELD